MVGAADDRSDCGESRKLMEGARQMNGDVGPPQPYRPPGSAPASASNAPGVGSPPTGPPASRASIGAYVRPTIYALIVAYAILFVFMNRESVPINFVFVTANVSMIFALLITLVIGAALAAGAGFWWRRRSAHRQDSAAGASKR